MVQQSEILVLLVAVALAPLGIWTLIRLRIPSKGLLSVGFVALYASYSFTIAEGFADYDLLNLLEHISYSITAWCFAFTLLRIARFWGILGGRGQP